MAYNDLQLDVIDQRVLAAMSRDTATGTLVARDPDSNLGSVIFDGDAVAAPVKVAASCWPRAGDRVCLQRFGSRSDWVVIGAFGNGQPNEDGGSVQPFSTLYATTSASYAVVPETSTFPFVKDRGDSFSRLRMEISSGAWTDVSSTQGRFAMRVTSVADGTFTDYDVLRIHMNTVSSHYKVSDWRYVSGVAAGQYTLQPVWRRAGGTGEVRIDNNDTISYAVREAAWPVTNLGA